MMPCVFLILLLPPVLSVPVPQYKIDSNSNSMESIPRPPVIPIVPRPPVSNPIAPRAGPRIPPLSPLKPPTTTRQMPIRSASPVPGAANAGLLQAPDKVTLSTATGLPQQSSPPQVHSVNFVLNLPSGMSVPLSTMPVSPGSAVRPVMGTPLAPGAVAPGTTNMTTPVTLAIMCPEFPAGSSASSFMPGTMSTANPGYLVPGYPLAPGRTWPVNPGIMVPGSGYGYPLAPPSMASPFYPNFAAPGSPLAPGANPFYPQGYPMIPGMNTPVNPNIATQGPPLSPGMTSPINPNIAAQGSPLTPGMTSPFFVPPAYPQTSGMTSPGNPGYLFPGSSRTPSLSAPFNPMFVAPGSPMTSPSNPVPSPDTSLPLIPPFVVPALPQQSGMNPLFPPFPPVSNPGPAFPSSPQRPGLQENSRFPPIFAQDEFKGQPVVEAKTADAFSPLEDDNVLVY
ncbi:proline-rich protein 36-like isoform X2 [Denticeps clupeoides]|uniref:proline-rich protein 36-like isoform X2 n=1 Tax=Denticeps clupeoides TaxID=299321 RepID=UPI0010A3ACA7|nr:proline-rich protein 36-like isoform X2 [Denticeps clupeoides]